MASIQDLRLRPGPRPHVGVAKGRVVVVNDGRGMLSRRWYILHYHRSTLLLPLGEVVADGGGVEERSEVMYCIEVRTYIYYKEA